MPTAEIIVEAAVPQKTLKPLFTETLAISTALVTVHQFSKLAFHRIIQNSMHA